MSPFFASTGAVAPSRGLPLGRLRIQPWSRLSRIPYHQTAYRSTRHVLGRVDPAVASPVVQISCAGEVDLGTGVRLVQTLPFEIQPQAAETTAAIIVAELPEPITAL